MSPTWTLLFIFAMYTSPLMKEDERVRIMDEMKLSLSTKFMRGMLAKLISKLIKKKYGYKVEIHISEIDLDMMDGQTHIHANVDLNVGSDDFKKLLKDISED